MNPTVILKETEKNRLRQFHTFAPLRNLKILLFYILAVGDAYVIVHAPSLIVRSLGWFLMSNLMFGLGVFMHDGAHRLLFKARSLNDFVSRVMATTLCFSFTQFKVTHLKHHAAPLTTRDPDISFFHHNIPITILSGAVRYFSVTFKAISEIGNEGDRRNFILELIAALTIWMSLLIVLAHKSWMHQFVQIFVIPYIILGPMTFARFVAEHFDGSAEGNEYKLSRVCLGNPVSRWFWNNINFHTVHHFYPGIPWYNLPRAYKFVESRLRENGSFIDQGYLQVLLRAFRKYGFSRPAYWNFPQDKANR